MNPITDTADAAPDDTAAEVAPAQALLRDMALVLRLTRRVKAEMCAEAAPEKAVIARARERVLEA